MKNLKKGVQAVTKGLKALTRKTESMAKKVAKLEKAQAAAKKKGAKLTATDQVVNIIKWSKKGVDVAGLMKKTGVGERTVRNILFKAGKQGKIKRAGRGLYVGA